jgi:glycosyltransferase involved in cell wall biosynthesis
VKQPLVVMLGTSLESPGGMTAVVHTLRKAGLFAKFDVKYVATYEGKGALRQMRVAGRAAATLLGLLLQSQVKLVHAHSASRGSFWRKSILCALAKAFNVTYVFHLHSGEFPVFYEQECGQWAQLWVRRTLRHAAAVICLAETWRTRLVAMEPAARVVVVGNPVDVPTQLPPSREQAIHVLFLGRLREKKGVFDLVRAMPTALGSCKQLRFVLAGDEGLDAVRDLAQQLGVAHAIELPGWVDGAAKDRLLAIADIFVLPSYFEGLPVGVLEAMALGVPVIATPVGGIPDLIEHQVSGMVVPPGRPDLIAEALVRLASDAELRSSIRDAAFERVSTRYSTEVIVAEISSLYERLGCPAHVAN